MVQLFVAIGGAAAAAYTVIGSDFSGVSGELISFVPAGPENVDFFIYVLEDGDGGGDKDSGEVSCCRWIVLSCACCSSRRCLIDDEVLAIFFDEGNFPEIFFKVLARLFDKKNLKRRMIFYFYYLFFSYIFSSDRKL